MKIAISGLNGHIGNNILRQLSIDGHNFHGHGRSPMHPSLASFNVNYFRGDILDEQNLYPFLDQVDILIHCAAMISIYKEDADKVMRCNVEGVKNMIKVAHAQGVKKIIYVSSIHAHRSKKDLQIDENSPYSDDHSPVYDHSKALGEKAMLEARKSGMDVCIINPTSVLGPNDLYYSLQGKMLKDMSMNKLNILIKGGFDWVDVRDIAAAVRSIIQKEIKNQKFILSGNYASFKKLHELVAKHYHISRSWILPIFICRTALPFIKLIAHIKKEKPLYTSSSLNTVAESSDKVSYEKAMEKLNYRPRALEESIVDQLKEIHS